MSTDIAKNELTMSERFMNMVIAEFTNGVGEIALTDFQKRLAQNYFIALDANLKSAEEKRAKKSEKYRDPVPVKWANVNMDLLARNVVSYARIGLDPAQKNHINLIPYKNNNTGKYDIGFVEGYRGIELKAIKYGLDVPEVVVELVFSNDKFKSYRKDRNNPVATYEFEVIDEFDRGEVKGGFYYHMYKNAPEKNKLVVFSLKDILKRKPEYASVEFWGGEKDKWENGKKVGKVHVEGWFEQMCYKTIYRAAFNDITIDSQKIDDDYMRLKEMEMTMSEAKVAEEISENANKEFIDINYNLVDEETGEIPMPEQDVDVKQGGQEIEMGIPAPETATSGPDF